MAWSDLAHSHNKHQGCHQTIIKAKHNFAQPGTSMRMLFVNLLYGHHNLLKIQAFHYTTEAVS